MHRLYKQLVPYEYRFWLYKQRNRAQFGRLRKRVNASPKGDFSLRKFDEYGCIFVHITKTAGTSVATALFGELPYHYSAVQYRVIFGRRDFNRYFKFAVVRNPWDRLLSAWKYLKQGGWDEKDAAWAKNNIGEIDNFNDFVTDWLSEKRIYSHIHFWPQSCFISDHRGNCLLDHIGYFEQIDTDFEEIAGIIGINRQLPHTNKSSSADYRDIYSSRAITRVSQLYHQDISRLGYAFDTYEKKQPW